MAKKPFNCGDGGGPNFIRLGHCRAAGRLKNHSAWLNGKKPFNLELAETYLARSVIGMRAKLGLEPFFGGTSAIFGGGVSSALLFNF